MHFNSIHAKRGDCARSWIGQNTSVVLLAVTASAYFCAEVAAQGLTPPVSLSPDIGARKIFFILFLMLGPIKILVPFVAMTTNADAAFRSRLATRATILSAAALALASLFGRNIMANFNVSLPVLALAGGLVLFLVALQTVLQQATGAGPAPTRFEGRQGMHLALNPLAFPTIVTPYGIAALIVFLTLADDDRAQELRIVMIVLGILAMNWVAMIFAQQILKWLGTALQIFAVVLGITQVAIGLQVIVQSLRLLGLMIPYPT